MTEKKKTGLILQLLLSVWGGKVEMFGGCIMCVNSVK